MFIATTMPSSKSVCILDTTDYTEDVCTLAEVDNYLRMGLDIDGVSLVDNVPVVNIKGRYSSKSDTNSEVTVWLRGDGQVVIRNNLADEFFIAKSKVKIPTKDYRIHDVELSETFVLFLVSYCKLVKGEAVIKSVVYKVDSDSARALKTVKSSSYHSGSESYVLSERPDGFYCGEEKLDLA